MEVGVADKVELFIYDVAGELQASTELTDSPSVVDGKYAYEYEWNTSNAASGVYICRIIATNGEMGTQSGILRSGWHFWYWF